MSDRIKFSIDLIKKGVDVSMHADPMTGNVNLDDDHLWDAYKVRPLLDAERLEGGSGRLTASMKDSDIDEL